MHSLHMDLTSANPACCSPPTRRPATPRCVRAGCRAAGLWPVGRGAAADGAGVGVPEVRALARSAWL